MQRALTDKLTPPAIKRMRIEATESIDYAGRVHVGLELILPSGQHYHLLVVTPAEYQTVLGNLALSPPENGIDPNDFTPLPSPMPPPDRNPFTVIIEQIASSTGVSPQAFAHASAEMVILQGDNGYPFRAARITMPNGAIYGFALLSQSDFRELTWEPNPAHRQLFPPAYPPPAMREAAPHSDASERPVVFQREPPIDHAPPAIRFHRTDKQNRS